MDYKSHFGLKFEDHINRRYSQGYHLITRADGKMMFFEYGMDYIDLENIQIKEVKNNSIHFTDGIQNYGFSMSKSTLYERFELNEPLAMTAINIVDDPFELERVNINIYKSA